MAGAPMGGTSGNAMSQGTPDQMLGDMVRRGMQPQQTTPSQQAFWAAHPEHAYTTYAPGYQQNWMNNWSAQQAQPQAQMAQFNASNQASIGAPNGQPAAPNAQQATPQQVNAQQQMQQQINSYMQARMNQTPQAQFQNQLAVPNPEQFTPGAPRPGARPGGQTPPPGMSIDEFSKSSLMGPMTMDFRQPVEFEGKQYDPRVVERYQNYVNQSSQQSQQPQMPSDSVLFQAPQGQQTNPNIMQSSANWINQAAQGTQAGMNYMPERVGFGGYTPFVGVGGSVPNVSAGGPTERIGDTGQQQRISAGQIGQTDLQQYINPYTQQVIDTSMADLERQRQMQQNELGAQASRAGAFGGSRQGVAEALTNEAFARTGAQTAANLRQQGFQQAQQAAGQDIGYRLQADLANQSVSGADLARQLQANLANQGVSAGDLARQLQAGMANQSAAGQNIGFGMQASLANQAARQADLQRMLQANQFNTTTGMTGAQQRLNAAQQLAGIAGQGFGMGQQLTQGLSAQGAMQQALQQALIDAARGQYSGFMGAPAQSLGYMGSALGASPTPQTTTATRQPGVFDFLTLAAMTAPSFR